MTTVSPTVAHARAVLVHRKDLADALERYEAELESGSNLDPLLRVIALATVARRNRALMDLIRPVGEQVGMSDEMFHAIDGEYWTDPCFTRTQSAIFEFALLYDAGHGIGARVYDKVCEALGPSQTEALSSLCGHWGAVTRLGMSGAYR